MLIKITKTINVNDLTSDDIKLLDRNTLLKIVTELTSKPSKPLVDTNPPVKPPLATTEHPQATVAKSTLKSLTPKKKHKTGDTTTGKKTGYSSKYHYVYFHTQSKAFTVVYGNKKQFSTELEAALAIDGWLDDRGDTKRPKNRDKFPEVMEAYERLNSPTPNIDNYINEAILGGN